MSKRVVTNILDHPEATKSRTFVCFLVYLLPQSHYNDWWFYAVEHHRELVETPIPPATTPDTQRWATFCAAMVEWLCWQEGLPFPAWTDQECYILQEPWFMDEKWSRRAWLLATTPAPFKMRNIYGGDRMFDHLPRQSFDKLF